MIELLCVNFLLSSYRMYLHSYVSLRLRGNSVHIDLASLFLCCNYDSLRQIPAIAEHSPRNSGEVPMFRSGLQLRRGAIRFIAR